MNLELDELHELEDILENLKNGKVEEAKKALSKIIDETKHSFIMDGICPICGGAIVGHQWDADDYENHCDECGEDYTE